MHLHFRNVNDAFRGLVTMVHQGTIPTRRCSSRVGEVLMVEEPVTVTYQKPKERVLFNQARDCNPFFHLFESLWMLAGRNDVESLAYYNPKMEDYSDDQVTLWGAYGHRWRSRFNLDQLRTIVYELKSNPDSRRCVLAMWDGGTYVKGGDNTADLLKVRRGGKDIPCNTHAYFSVRCPVENLDPREIRYLDMTVCNRSNDLIWGMLGANVVHMSILQEYLAACIGVDVGIYNQMTNNLHVYTERWEPEKWLQDNDRRLVEDPFPLVQDPTVFDRECLAFIESIDGTFTEPFFKNVAQPMMAAFRAHKRRNYVDDNNALTLAARMEADDWREVAITWIERRRIGWSWHLGP